MPRTTKKDAKPKASKKGVSIFDDEEKPRGEEEEGLPKDEVGRRKIKRQYEDLLGIRPTSRHRIAVAIAVHTRDVGGQPERT